VLILSAYCESEYVYSLFAAGAKGYLLKDEAPERIVTGIRQVMRGEPALSLPVQRVLLTRKSKPEHDLSARELEVLRMIAKGNTNEEIAEALVIAIGTVKNHVMNIYKKLPNVRTRSEAVAWAWENRIVEVE
jgi:DNA-binding NarL/FixJ family response regulator